jgi:hypothetical protein
MRTCWLAPRPLPLIGWLAICPLSAAPVRHACIPSPRLPLWPPVRTSFAHEVPFTLLWASATGEDAHPAHSPR